MTWALRLGTLLLSSKSSFHSFRAQVLTIIHNSTDISQDGRFIYLTLTTANHIAALDISDLNNVKRLDDPDEDQPTVGPHYVKVTPDQKHLVVSAFFLFPLDALLTVLGHRLLCPDRRDRYHQHPG